MFSLWDNIHRFKTCFPDPLVPKQIPTPVFDEVLSLMLLFNLVNTDLTAEVSPVIGATDASTEGLGGVEAVVPQALARELFQRSQLRGDKVCLGSVILRV